MSPLYPYLSPRYHIPSQSTFSSSQGSHDPSSANRSIETQSPSRSEPTSGRTYPSSQVQQSNFSLRPRESGSLSSSQSLHPSQRHQHSPPVSRATDSINQGYQPAQMLQASTIAEQSTTSHHLSIPYMSNAYSASSIKSINAPSNVYHISPYSSYSTNEQAKDSVGDNQNAKYSASPSSSVTSSTRYASTSSSRTSSGKEKPTFKCEREGCTSNALFTRIADLQRHYSTVHNEGRAFPCHVKRCSRVGHRGFSRRDHLTEHLRSYHQMKIPKRGAGQRSGPLHGELTDAPSRQGHRAEPLPLFKHQNTQRSSLAQGPASDNEPSNTTDTQILSAAGINSMGNPKNDVRKISSVETQSLQENEEGKPDNEDSLCNLQARGSLDKIYGLTDRFPNSEIIKIEATGNELANSLEGISFAENPREPEIPMAQRTITNLGERIITRNELESLSSSSPNNSESFWSSDWSEATPTLDEDNKNLLGRYRHLAVDRLISEFDSRCNPEGKSCPTHQDTQGSRKSESSSKTAREASETTPQKRKQGFLGEDITKNAEEDANKKLNKRRFRRFDKEKRLILACPFGKKDPLRYQACNRRLKMTKISFVKQHLSRSHRLPIYCPLCMNTFDNEEERDIHTRARSCQVQPVVQWEGITAAQKELLTQRVPPKMSEEEQWFTIFDILFPGHHPRPRSAYLDNDLSEDLCLFRDFATAEGPAIMLQRLREDGYSIQNHVADLSGFLEIVVADGLQVIFDRWMDSRRQQNLADADSGIFSSSPAGNMLEDRSSSALPITHNRFTAHELPTPSWESDIVIPGSAGAIPCQASTDSTNSTIVTSQFEHPDTNWSQYLE